MTIENLLKNVNGEIICSLYFERRDKWRQELTAAEVLKNYGHRFVKNFYPALQFTNCNASQLVIVL